MARNRALHAVGPEGAVDEDAPVTVFCPIPTCAAPQRPDWSRDYCEACYTLLTEPSFIVCRAREQHPADAVAYAYARYDRACPVCGLLNPDYAESDDAQQGGYAIPKYPADEEPERLHATLEYKGETVELGDVEVTAKRLKDAVREAEAAVQHDRHTREGHTAPISIAPRIGTLRAHLDKIEVKGGKNIPDYVEVKLTLSHVNGSAHEIAGNLFRWLHSGVTLELPWEEQRQLTMWDIIDPDADEG